MIGRLLRCLCLAIACTLASCKPYEPPSEWPEASPPIWEITSPAGQRGWIFGTVHALPDDLYWGSAKLDETFDRAGVVVVEVANLDDPAGMGLFAELSESPGQPPLLQRVEPEERPALRRLLADADMAEDDFDGIESWAAAMVLSAAVRTGDPMNGVDRIIIHNADEVIGLETFALQMAIFDRLSPEAQSDLLYGVAHSHETNSDNAMLLAWLTGNERELAARVNEAVEFSPELRRALLTDRNRRWVTRIAELIDEGRKPFVAVGAGHVVGEDGVVALLQARGYQARRIQ